VGIKVFQGEREMAADNNMLGQVGGRPPAQLLLKCRSA
jgi:molecular chaperone DnaK (HSP70)